jgi:hypothetical protein
MKQTIPNLTAAAVIALAFLGGHTILGQSSDQTITTITGAGTISDFSPETIVVKTDADAPPVIYTYTKSTIYVDENGNPVSMETVKSGLPVTVYYIRDGDNRIASKVVVRKMAIVPAVHVEESKTTTTTTTTNK